MNTALSGSPFRTIRALTASLLLAVGLGGCAAKGPLPVRPAPGTLPAGSPLLSQTLPETDAWLRHHLMSGEYDGALALLRRSRIRPRDTLLRALQEGAVLHYEGRYAESNRIFEWAEREADRRYTRSVSRAAGSLLINDRVLLYSPTPAELTAIPYFRMLNYLALGDLDGAAVEARKSSALMARLHADKAPRCGGTALMQYMSGLVFEKAGAWNDALVSLRQAERSFDACASGGKLAPPVQFGSDLFRTAQYLGIEDIADSAAARYRVEMNAADPAMADLVVLVEHGFAAHRMQQDIHVPILPDDVEGLESSDIAGIMEAAGQVTSRLVASFTEQRAWDYNHFRDRRGAEWDPLLEGAHVLKLSWPVLQLDANRAVGSRIVVGESVADALPLEDVSALLMRDFEAQRAMILSRMVARGIIKYLVSQEAEKRAEKKWGDFAGFLAGLLTNTAANALEQADTRSWSLLPDQISLARLRVPAGEHHVRVEVLSAGGVAKTLDLGKVNVQAGERVFLSRRVWDHHPSQPSNLAGSTTP